MANIVLPYALVKHSLQSGRENHLKVYAALRMCPVPAGFGTQFREATLTKLSTITTLSRSTVRNAIAYWTEMGFVNKVRGHRSIYALKGLKKVHEDIISANPGWVDCLSPGGRKAKMIRYDAGHFDTFEAKDLFFATFMCEEALRQRNGRRHRLRTRIKANLRQPLVFQLALRTIAKRLSFHYVTVSNKIHRLKELGLLQVKHDAVSIQFQPGLRCEDLNGLYQSRFKQRIFTPTRTGFIGWGPNLYIMESFYDRRWTVA